MADEGAALAAAPAPPAEASSAANHHHAPPTAAAARPAAIHARDATGYPQGQRALAAMSARTLETTPPQLPRV